MEKTHQQIKNSFDDFFNSEVETPKPNEKKDELKEKFEKERQEWTAKIKELSSKLKNVLSINELMVDVYTERQRAVEYYHYLIGILSIINKSYRKQFSEKHEYYTYKSQKRFTNERTKEIQIQTDLSDIVKKREYIDNHSKFIDNTIKTLDNLIYGIKYRIEIEQISRGK